MDVDLSYLDVVALVVVVAGVLIAGRALSTRLGMVVVVIGGVGLSVLFGSLIGAMFAWAALGVSLAVGMLIKERDEQAARPTDSPTKDSPTTDSPTTDSPTTDSPTKDSRSGPPVEPSAVWTNPDELTPREAEVLALIAAGHSNQAIAEELHISMATVKTHVNRVFAKTGARDRAQAVVYAYEEGLTALNPRVDPP